MRFVRNSTSREDGLYFATKFRKESHVPNIGIALFVAKFLCYLLDRVSD